VTAGRGALVKAASVSRWAGRALAVAAATAAFAIPCFARNPNAVLHERIAPNAAEDEAMHATTDRRPGTASETSTGAGTDAPDPGEQPATSALAYTGAPSEPYRPDRDTARPRISSYDDPFIPSTAPFKRVVAFDAVGEDYSLTVRDRERVPLPMDSPAGAGEQTFYCDLAVELAGAEPIRIPSVGPGAHVLRARLSAGTQSVPFRLLHDGADNWFVEPTDSGVTGRARLVMTLAIAPVVLGGPLRDNPWQSMFPVPPLPHNVEHEAGEVLAAVGVDRRMRPLDAIGQLVRYFRGFTDSSAPTPARRSIYLDLALSKRGVCRHRAFAFLVTAQGLGIPTRMVANEAHAWIEVHDGTRWHRIDLGGAGELENVATRRSDDLPYEPPEDPFQWPDGARRGSDMIAQARARGSSTADLALSRTASVRASSAEPGPGATSSHAASHPTGPDAPAGADANTSGTLGASAPPATAISSDTRPPSTIDLQVDGFDIRRGSPVRLRGAVRSANGACPYAAVDLWLRDLHAERQARLGTVATDDHGAFAAQIVVPRLLPLGDYDVVAHTQGTGHCGGGGSN
jgi:transglutaminase-like putative cysteine protease